MIAINNINFYSNLFWFYFWIVALTSKNRRMQMICLCPVCLNVIFTVIDMQNSTHFFFVCLDCFISFYVCQEWGGFVHRTNLCFLWTSYVNHKLSAWMIMWLAILSFFFLILSVFLRDFAYPNSGIDKFRIESNYLHMQWTSFRKKK